MSRFSMCFIAALLCGSPAGAQTAVDDKSTAGAQTVVRGRVKDAASGVAVEYATVAAERDSVVVAAAASSKSGVFDLPVAGGGEFRVEITAVGYTPFTTTVAADGRVHDLGDVELKQGIDVDAVVLTVQKPIVTADAEKLSYSVEDDPEAQSSTLEEIIRKVPQLSIDAEGNVLMNGQSDYKILVNGHQSSSMSNNFKDIVRSMPASSIKRLEVITNPSMKYDAEGAGGVLNIITAKTRFDGYNGSVNLTAGNWFDRNWYTNNSANMTFQTGKFALSAGLYYSQHWADGDETGAYDQRIENLGSAAVDTSYYKYQNSHTSGKSTHLNIYGNIETSYQADSLNLLTAEVGVYNGWSHSLLNGDCKYLDDAERFLSGFTQSDNIRYSWLGVDVGVNYEHTFGREEHTLTISEGISVSPSDTDTNKQHIEPMPDSDMVSQNYMNTDLQRGVMNVVQIDYRNPVDKRHTVEAGAKHTYDFNRVCNIFEHTTADATLEPSNGITRLTRNILGIYAGYTYSVEKFNVRAGGRLEGAWYALNSEQDGKPQKYGNRLVNVVPYLSLTAMPKQGHTLALSYTERLSRPSVYSMSPFVSEDTNTRRYGNPELKTGVGHTMSLRYSFANNKWSAAAGVMVLMSNNMVSNYSFLDKDGKLHSTYANKGRLRMYGAEGSMSFRPSNKFSMSMSVRAGWGEYRLSSQGIANAGWAMSQNLNVTAALWKGARLSLSENLILPEPQIAMHFKSWIVSTSARIGQKLLKEKLEVSLVVNNPHSGYRRQKFTEQTPTYVRSIGIAGRVRTIQLSVSYRFGKQGLAVKSTNRKTDDGGDDVAGADKGGGM